ncbi:MOSC domain-containing protein [Altererythrobacter sp. CC-YST694]|uniref:MOSC domain-containing protein n=1 Tax=Altererythrobacter sp. CC-YST694 TaxID=2755038 RepID=UPI001D01661C|nr:MOSC domain-containing protein [Altererythrobacter sp. CC-YST694]MCB5424376.1 MOSC domain-containing protein [Altererythrobacter sp. CC-YST694]
MQGVIISVASDGEHRFSKQRRTVLHLVAGPGVAGDAHAGSSVRHRSRVAKNPAAPNLRQLHLIHAELLEELARKGLDVKPGQLGENVTTRGVDLLRLSAGTRLLLGSQALIEITGLRNPCRQIDQNIAPGAMVAMLDRREDGSLVRKASVMAIVLKGGEVRAGDTVTMEWAPARPVPLGPV